MEKVISHTSVTHSVFRKNINPIFIIALLIFSVNTFPGVSESLGKQAATTGMIFSGVFLLFFYLPKKIALINLPFLFLFLYTSYVVINNLLNAYISHSTLIINDFAEPLRVIGLLVFFLLGAATRQRIKSTHLEYFFIAYISISIILFLGWFLGGYFTTGLYDFYISRDGRYSGFFSSVNYVWASSVIMVGLSLLYYNKVKVNFNYWLIIALVVLVSLLSLLLSGGRASLFAFLVSLLVLVFWGGYKSRKLFISSSLIVVIIAVVLIQFAPLFISQLDRGVDRVIELVIALQQLDLAQIESFQARLNLWKSGWDEISQRLAFGHGSSKAGIRVIDNTYLMSLYRYGLTGLILEILIYTTFIWICLKRLRINFMYSLPIAFSVAYFLSGITSSPFYELKTPYLYFYLIGWFTSCSPYIQEIKKDSYIKKFMNNIYNQKDSNNTI